MKRKMIVNEASDKDFPRTATMVRITHLSKEKKKCGGKENNFEGKELTKNVL